MNVGGTSANKGQLERKPPTMNRKTKRQLKNNIKRFIKKTSLRLLTKIVEIAALFALGSAFGLKLVRY